MYTACHQTLAPETRPVNLAVTTALTEHRSEFLRFLVRRLGDRDTAEDVLQGFCLRVVANGGNLRKSESVVAWLYTVLRSVLTDHYRREAARRRREASYVDERVALDESPDAVEPEESPCGCLDKLVPTLRPDYAEILQRVDLSDEPREKTVAKLGLTQGNARVRLHRARQALREAMRECCGSCCERGFHDCTCGNGHHLISAEADQAAFSYP